MTVEFSWPGVYFEGRFRGTGLGVVLDCAAADYDVQVDGTTVATLVTPGDTTHWIGGLRDGEHTVRVVRRNDTPGDTSTFGGFVAAPGGTVLGRPAPRDRQIEFIGDSLTMGYGNVSGTRACDPEQLRRTTNSDVSHGALTARQLDADYQINGLSGLGMVRNVAADLPGRHVPDLLRPRPAERGRRRLAEPGDVAPPGRGGQPRLQRLLRPHPR